MAQGVDPRIKLAQAAAEKSPEQIKGLKSMFDVLNKWHAGSGEKQEYKAMATFYELTGVDLKKEQKRSGGLITETGENVDFFGMFGIGVAEAAKKEETAPAKVIEMKETEAGADLEEEQETDSLFGFFADMEFPGSFRKTDRKQKRQHKGMKQVINF